MQLARRSVLQATDCPESLGGSLRLLGVLREILRAYRPTWLDDREDWQKEIESLDRLIRAMDVRHGDAPTEADKRSEIWREIQACLYQRSQARAMATVRDALDPLLLRMILVCSAEHQRVDPSMISALRQLYKLGAHVSGGNRDWRDLLLALQDGKDLSKWMAEAQTTLVIKRFCKNLHSFLKSTVGSPITAGRPLLSATNDALEDASTQGSEGADQEEANPLSLDLTDPTAIATSKRRPFVQGDSILGHCCQSVLRDQSLARLGEHHWDCAPPAIAKRVASRLVHRVRDTKCLDELGTCLVAMGVFSTGLPVHIFVSLPLFPTRDLHLNLTSGWRAYSRTYFLDLLSFRGPDLDAVDKTWTAEDIEIRIPMSKDEHAGLLKLWEKRPAAKHVSDLLGMNESSSALADLTRNVHSLLKDLSDGGFQVYPGKWSNSLAPLAVEVLGDTQLVSLLAHRPGLSSPGAQHYLHLPDTFVSARCDQLYAALGWGGSCELPQRQRTAFETLPSIKNVQIALQAMEVEMHQASIAVRRGPALSEGIADFNRLCELSAFTVIFVFGGRGSKVEDIYNGDLLIDDDLAFLSDKQVDAASSDRIIGKIDYVKHVIYRFLHSQQEIYQQIRPTLPRNTGDAIRNIAKGPVGFDVACFQRISKSAGSFERKPLLAADLERVSQRFFNAGKNIGRHLLVTYWSLLGLDDLLLRAITGHASGNNSVPSRFGTYSPLSVIAQTIEALQRLHAPWLPKPLVCTNLSVTPAIQAIPVARIRKLHGEHRKWITTHDRAPGFNWLHLASRVAIQELRDHLVAGNGPNCATAGLMLHLVVFDGLHHLEDLRAIFCGQGEDSVLESGGTVLAFQRQDSPHRIRIPLQTVTATYVRHKTVELSSLAETFESLQDTLADWLLSATRAFRHGNRDSNTPSDVTMAQLMACAALTCDLEVPSALQIAYEPGNATAILDDFSSGRLLGVQGRLLGKPYAPPAHTTSIDADLDEIRGHVNKCADTKRRLGEEKARAALLFERLQQCSALGTDSLGGAIVDALIKNIEHIRTSHPSKIQISSVSTYLSTLLPNLKRVSEFRPHSSAPDEWQTFSASLYKVQSKANGNGAEHKGTEDKKTQQRNAATWFLRRLQECEYEVSLPAEMPGGRHAAAHPTPTAICYISPEEVDAVRVSLIESNPHDPLRQQSADAVTRLLPSTPVRWGEACALTRTDLLVLDYLIVIQSHGFSHIKSHAAFRLAPLGAAALESLKTLAQLNRELHIPNGNSEFLLAQKRDGVATQQCVDWLHNDLTQGMFSACGNPLVRVHSLRAMAVCELAFVGWAPMLKRFSQGLASAAEHRDYFGYHRDQAWRLERVARSAGHGNPGVTIAHYLGCSMQMRSLSLAGILENYKAPAWGFAAIGRTPWAWRSDARRRGDDARCDWTYLRRQLCRQVRAADPDRHAAPLEGTEDVDIERPSAAQPQVAQALTSAEAHTLHAKASLSIPAEKAIRYLALRLINEAIPTATAISGITHAIGVYLENVNRNMSVELRQTSAALARDLTPGTRKSIRDHLQEGWSEGLLRRLGALEGTELSTAILRLLLREVETATWEEQAFGIGQLLSAEGLYLRVVRDRARRNGFTSGRLHGRVGVVDGGYASDVGEIPKFFVAPVNGPHNKRAMGVLSRLTKLVCMARGALMQDGVVLQWQRTGA